MANHQTVKTSSAAPGGLLIPLFCVLSVGLFTAALIFSGSREIFRQLSVSHPYLLGFFKFALLATVGELFAVRISSKKWTLPSYCAGRAAVWGIIGLGITFFFKLYAMGAAGMIEAGLLPGFGFLPAFWTSLLANITFGPVMMGFHKMSDTYFDLKSKGRAGLSIAEVNRNVDWTGFVSFVVFRTIPLFWIPAHTITFSLPGEYQTAMAAYLSMALGIILSLRK